MPSIVEIRAYVYARTGRPGRLERHELSFWLRRESEEADVAKALRAVRGALVVRGGSA